MGLFLPYNKELPQEEWNKRFYNAINKDTRSNRAGYGPDKPFIPPLQNPQTVYAVIERHELLYETGNAWNWYYFLFSVPFMAFLNGVGNGDSSDWYWYNNAEAEGA